MVSQILETKLYIPQIRGKLASRQHLIDRLNDNPDRKLILITAPAGYGKSTLVSGWANRQQGSVAWLSLEELDNELNRFMTYLIAALQSVKPEIGAEALLMLGSPQTVPTETILTTLISDIAFVVASREDSELISANLTLVLDDYHFIKSQVIHDAIEFLLRHLPSGFQMIIVSRMDPPLRISRLRARRELMEVREADLRFTLEETQHILNHIEQLNLTETQVERISRRTEGWITGLHLAVLTMRNHKQRDVNLNHFIEHFTGDNRFIADYLIDEVIDSQTDTIKEFLLLTSVLDRMTGGLCDAVTDQQNSQTILEQLESSNLFLIAMDDRRQWYRYHHLFADLLRHRLQITQPELIRTLHGRAALWHEKHTGIAQAIEHYLKARDYESAVTLIEKVGLTMIHQYEFAQLPAWLAQLPDTVIQANTLLRVCHAWVQYHISQTGVSETELQGIEDALRSDVSAGNTNPSRMQELQGQVAALRTYIALYNDELDRAIELAHQTLDILSTESTIRAPIAMILGHAYFRTDKITAAQQAYTEAKTISHRIGNTYQMIAAMCNLGAVEAVQAHLNKALSIFQDLIDMSDKRKGEGKQQFSVMGHVYIAASQFLYQFNHLETAREAIQEGIRLGKYYNRSDILIDGYTMLARIHHAQGDFDVAHATLQQVDGLLQNPQSDPAQRYWAEVCRVRLWLTQGRSLEARRWADESGLRLDDEIGFLHNPEYILFVHILISEIEPDSPNKSDVLNLLNRLIEKAEARGRIDKVLEMYCLYALAYYSYGEIETALQALRRALSLAEPEGFIRVFVDYDSTMAQLLNEAVKNGIYPEYCNELLKSFPERNETNNSDRAQSELVDPLTDRELGVLRLMSQDYAYQEIADELVVSLNTVRYHTKNIYSKLGVNKKSHAITEARKLNLI